MYKVLGISRSTYYKCFNCKKSNRDTDNQNLDEDIFAIYYDTKRRYGVPMIHRELLEKGWHVSLKRVQRRMALLGIRSIVIKKIATFQITNLLLKKKIY